MTTLQMECFLEAAKFHSFSLAAANLYLSQPTLSRHIQALETEFNVALFLRTNNTVVLTEAGQELVSKISTLYEAHKKAEQACHDIASKYRGRLYIGLQAGHRLPENVAYAMRTLKKETTGLHMQICHMELEASYGALMDASIDALLCNDETMPISDKLERLVLSTSPMYLAVPKDHPNANMDQISLQKIPQYFGDIPYLIPPQGNMVISAQPELEDIRLVSSAEVLTSPYTDIDNILMMVDAGLAAASVGGQSLLAENDHVRLIPMVSEDKGVLRKQQVRLCLYWKKDNTNRLLLNLLQQIESLL